MSYRIAETRFLIEISLATAMILRMTYFNENTEKIITKKSTLTLTGSSSVVIGGSVGTAPNMETNLESKQGHPEYEFNEYPCTAVCSRIIPPMSELYLHLRSNARDVSLKTLNKNLIKNRQALLAQGIAEIVPTQSFIFKMANWSS